ncbi:MAG: bifunctional demethylmenaquinone methyltransferase/2-methoxy-6-polyprenyl-1,4-benzoquinol methylase UbiE [Bacteroidales bacterium]|nr:bifunctional demethylmenaquinone methyltransferase/2-methoxy-6-polyprenyl-1,4-benzoquinol methylase UbiE [Bacteroidales bacterium]MBD5222212.1 bifunctional demethylmenaquinone methyltransferase/2-methoxy-6-polyprenyl-1,4-benzoquinol methylase UbiE [Bacteroidales bacterium]
MKDNKKCVSTGSPRVESVDPYTDTRAKGEQVEEMFDSIAPAYDFMNTAMTFGMHRAWRDKALKMLADHPHERILDVATGTGDVALRMHEIFPDAAITGIDLSEGMLKVAREKAAARPGVAEKVSFSKADCLALPFEAETFDVVTVAYGVRNFQELAKGYGEMLRVLKPGGMICVIELSEPENPLMHLGYRIYSRGLIPLVGRLVSGDSRAYTYLPESIAACPQRERMTGLMEKVGFASASFRSLFPGAVTIYTAFRPKTPRP